MKKIAMLLAVAALLVPLAPIHAEGENHTLPGEYHWDQGDKGGEVEAVFTPSGEGTWDVSFHFKFDGEDHIYKGTAEGSLSNGTLKGEVKADKRPVTFSFEGTFTDGKFSGTHEQVREDGNVKTGTLTMGG